MPLPPHALAEGDPVVLVCDVEVEDIFRGDDSIEVTVMRVLPAGLTFNQPWAW